MTQTVAKILHLEDSDLDAELLRDRLEKSDLSFTLQRVSDRRSFTALLQEVQYDLIIADYQVPAFEGVAALELAQSYQPDIPFIYVSGAMGEELAVETLQRGATDYILKDRLTRLASAIIRALAEADERKRRKRADHRALAILESMNDGFVTYDRDWTITFLNAAAEQLVGRTRSCLLGKNFWDEFPDTVGTEIEQNYRLAMTEQKALEFESFYPPWNRWFALKAYPHSDGLSVYFRDVTDRKAAEEELARTTAIEQRRSKLLSRVAEASRSINAVLSVDSIVRVLAGEARRIVDCHCSIARHFPFLEETPIIQIPSLTDKYEALRGREFGPSKLSCHVRQTNQPLCLSEQDFLEQSQWHEEDPSECERFPLRGWLGVPLIGHGGDNLGLIELSDKLEGDFTPEDEAVLLQLAAIAAVGIENARLYERLKEQDQRKDEFLATLAHELRNPLAPVRNGLTVLRLATSPEETLQAREMMERQVGHMVRLIDDLLDVSRITRGKVELRCEEVTIQSILDAALEVSRPLIEAARHEMRITVTNEPLILHADLTRMAQVVSNLLNNSAKYTPKGGQIELSADREGSEVIIRVRDNGIGIAREMLPKVFEMFTQVGRSLERSQGGLGIGLALVTKLVEMHGGTITATSQGLGEGSTFTVRLPLCLEPSAPASHTFRELDSSRQPQRRILVVDDNVDSAETLAMLLSLEGHTTQTAHHGRMALEVAEQFEPDAVFLDIGLPGMSGYEVARKLRCHPKLQNATLIALTGWGTDDDRRQARDAGFDHHLTKPVESQAVMELLKNIMPRSQRHDGEPSH